MTLELPHLGMFEGGTFHGNSSLSETVPHAFKGTWVPCSLKLKHLELSTLSPKTLVPQNPKVSRRTSQTKPKGSKALNALKPKNRRAAEVH